MLLHITGFLSFPKLNNIPLYVCTTLHLFIYQWTFKYIHIFLNVDFVSQHIIKYFACNNFQELFRSFNSFSTNILVYYLVHLRIVKSCNSRQPWKWIKFVNGNESSFSSLRVMFICLHIFTFMLHLFIFVLCICLLCMRVVMLRNSTIPTLLNLSSEINVTIFKCILLSLEVILWFFLLIG